LNENSKLRVKIEELKNNKKSDGQKEYGGDSTDVKGLKTKLNDYLVTCEELRLRINELLNENARLANKVKTKVVGTGVPDQNL
jgi:hypothetical protein